MALLAILAKHAKMQCAFLTKNLVNFCYLRRQGHVRHILSIEVQSMKRPSLDLVANSRHGPRPRRSVNSSAERVSHCACDHNNLGRGLVLESQWPKADVRRASREGERELLSVTCVRRSQPRASEEGEGWLVAHRLRFVIGELNLQSKALVTLFAREDEDSVDKAAKPYLSC